MSAQMITALRQRADELDLEANAMLELHRERLVNVDTGHVRERHWLRFLATEFRRLADTAEGKPPWRAELEGEVLDAPAG